MSQPRLPDAASFTVESLNRPEVIANPYPWYALLRDQPPQFGLRDWPPGTVPGQDVPEPSWVFLKYADVAAAAKNHDAFSSRTARTQKKDKTMFSRDNFFGRCIHAIGAALLATCFSAPSFALAKINPDGTVEFSHVAPNAASVAVQGEVELG